MLQNRLRGAPGTPWGPLWKHASVLGVFFNRFFDFFSDFGEPWGPPFSPLFGPDFKTLLWTPFVIALKSSRADFGSILGAILEPFWGILWVSVRE